MRVLHVMAGAAEGGAETMMVDSALALAEAGLPQHVLTRADNPHRLERLRDAKIDVTTASFDKLWRMPTAAALQYCIEQLRPDVLHFWMGRAGSYAPRAWADRSLGWYGGYYKLNRFKHCGWHAGVTSDISRHILEQGAPSERVVTLPVFTRIAPAPPVDRASLRTPDEAPVVLALARLHWKKGLDVLLHALAEMPGVYGWIAGAGPLETDLHNLAEALGLADRVRFLGWRNDRAALLAACDVVAFPSRYEPFGAVTIEAWAARRPLVVADAAGPAATVTHEENALLVPRDDAAALAAALRRVLDEGDLAARLTHHGWRDYHARFTEQAFVRSALALYERMCKAPPLRSQASRADAAALSGAA